MDCDTLRAWVRGTLPLERRREVGRYLLRCSDPALPGILRGLIQEHELEQRARAWLRGRRLRWRRG
jgi:hypothetical protein